MTHDLNIKLLRRGAMLAGVCAAAIAGQAGAQTMDTNSAAFNGGWGRYPGQENHAIDVSTRDANGNRIIVDGLIQDGDASEYTDTSGAGGTYAGAGSRRWSNATAIGNNLQVITQGNYNTVIVNSTQINNGAVTASNNAADPAGDDSLNGELDLND